jgi:hypothetical protein
MASPIPARSWSSVRSGPDQFDASLVEAALDELPCESSGLSVRRDEYEQRIRAEVSSALKERCEVRIRHRHLDDFQDLSAAIRESIHEHARASVPGAKSEWTTTTRLLPFFTAHSAMMPDCCPNVKLVRTM